jgi:type VI secretion system protein ImpG
VSDELYPYYERELIFIRQLAAEFARKYPAAAGRLMIEPDRSADPHIERLIDSFALLAARVQHKLDDEFPELIQALLGVLYPHYLVPIPSMAVLQFVLDPKRTKLPDGFLIAQGSRLRTLPVGPASCRYRTAYPVTLWPVGLSEAEFLLPPFPPGPPPPQRTEAVLRLQLECTGGLPLSALSLDTLRFYLSGEPTLIAALYEIVFNHALSVVIRPLGASGGTAPIALEPADCLGQVGFEPHEGLLPYPRQSFLGYRLLTELFTFPSKFLFVDLKGLSRAARAGFGQRFEVRIFLDRGSETFEQGVNRDTFRLGCAPVVNLFEQTAEPIPLAHTRHEHKIVPDVTHNRGHEVYSVDSVVGSDTRTGTTREYLPFYAFRHGSRLEQDQAFYVASRRPGRREGDRGTDVFLNLVDRRFDPYQPPETTLVVRTTCTNRDLPVELRRAGERLLFDLETAAPLAAVRCLRMPTLPLRPPVRRGAFWRLVSHLNLNYLSLADSSEGRDALQELLRLYDYTSGEGGSAASAVTNQLVEGITAVSSRRVTGRVAAEAGADAGFCRGVEVTLELDEQRYIGVGSFLFASVMERFFGLYASINSFTQIVARGKQDGRVIKRWPPRAGVQQLI